MAQARTEAHDAERSRPLDRYVCVLELLAAFPEGLPLIEVAEALSLHKATAHRLLKALAETGLVTSGTHRGHRYQLGQRFQQLLQAGSDDGQVDVLSRPHLHSLTADTGETSYITRLRGARVHMVSYEAPEARWRDYVRPGLEAPPHAGASAKAILAFQNEAIIVRALSGTLPALTAHTHTDVRWVRAEYARVRKQDYATCESEVNEGLGAIAVPIRLPTVGVMYSVGLTGPLQRIMGNTFKKHLGRLRQAAEGLSHALDLTRTSRAAS